MQPFAVMLRGLVVVTALCVVLAGLAQADERPDDAPNYFAFEHGELIGANPIDVPASNGQAIGTGLSESMAGFGDETDTAPTKIASSEARSWSPGMIRRTVALVPEYLPEGMIPVITGPTSDAHRANVAGRPLQGTSWLVNSHSAGMFLGPIGGAALIDDHLEKSFGGLFGLRFGIDYDHRWGLEKRFGFAQMNVNDLIQHQRQIVSLELGDIDWMFYPWGDTWWRPYMSTGVGLAHFNYESETGRHIDRLLIGLPFGIGLKYFWNEGVALRFEIVDNLMLGTREISTMNNLAALFGVEFRYSGFHFGYES